MTSTIICDQCGKTHTTKSIWGTYETIDGNQKYVYEISPCEQQKTPEEMKEMLREVAELIEADAATKK